jgi:hypothetical protein
VRFLSLLRESLREEENAGAAPHLPAGINFSTLAIGEIINEIKLRPVITGRRWRQPDEGQRSAQPLA